jgi:MerR family transcriptional regulator/heat shock protein HspR
MQPSTAHAESIAWERSASFFALLNEALGEAQVVEEKAGPDAQGRLAGVYIISVAARLAQMHPQTLRKYDREDLVIPSRTEGMLRLYSDEDVERLRIIGRLVDDLGLNLEGVRLVLGMVEVLKDVIYVLENASDVADMRTASLAAEELRGIIGYVSGG